MYEGVKTTMQFRLEKITYKAILWNLLYVQINSVCFMTTSVCVRTAIVDQVIW